MPAGFAIRTSYAGSKGTRLMTLREINAAVYAPGATTATTNQRRPFAPALGQTTLVEPVGNSTYHAFQLTGERRFSHGFSPLANYQFSKSIVDTSANKGTGQVRTNPNSQAFDKGLSDFNRTHAFTLSSVWDMPSDSATALRILLSAAGVSTPSPRSIPGSRSPSAAASATPARAPVASVRT